MSLALMGMVAVCVLEVSISLSGSVYSGRGLLGGELVYGALHCGVNNAGIEEEHAYDLLDTSLCLL
jgi:hypothetical protein